MADSKKHEWIFDGIECLDSIRPDAFLLYKSKKYLQCHKLSNTDDELATDFRNETKKTLECLKKEFSDKDVRIKNFPYEITDEKAVCIIDSKKYTSIQQTITEIMMNTDLGSDIAGVGTNNVRFYAMYFKIDGKSIIVFNELQIIHKFERGKKLYISALYDDSKLIINKSDALKFTTFTPCIYFEEYDKLIAWDIKKTMKMFLMIEYYKEKAIKIFQDSDIIKIGPSVLEKGLNNSVNAIRISRMIEQNAFEKDIDFYKAHLKFFNENKDLNDRLIKLIIRDDHVIINNRDEFDSFLHITDQNIQQPVVNMDDDTFIAIAKRKVRTINDRD